MTVVVAGRERQTSDHFSLFAMSHPSFVVAGDAKEECGYVGNIGEGQGDITSQQESPPEDAQRYLHVVTHIILSEGLIDDIAGKTRFHRSR